LGRSIEPIVADSAAGGCRDSAARPPSRALAPALGQAVQLGERRGPRAELAPFRVVDGDADQAGVEQERHVMLERGAGHAQSRRQVRHRQRLPRELPNRPQAERVAEGLREPDEPDRRLVAAGCRGRRVGEHQEVPVIGEREARVDDGRGHEDQLGLVDLAGEGDPRSDALEHDVERVQRHELARPRHLALLRRPDVALERLERAVVPASCRREQLVAGLRGWNPEQLPQRPLPRRELGERGAAHLADRRRVALDRLSNRRRRGFGPHGPAVVPKPGKHDLDRVRRRHRVERGRGAAIVGPRGDEAHEADPGVLAVRPDRGLERGVGRRRPPPPLRGVVQSIGRRGIRDQRRGEQEVVARPGSDADVKVAHQARG
jgi:hypothetical protein